MAEMRTPEERREIVEKCIELEMSGESVLNYLREEGYLTPRATWINIQKKYLGRSDAQHSITEGNATGVKKRGKRPKIREEALEEDRKDWERAHAETVMFGGKEYEKVTVTTCCPGSTREGVEVTDVLPEDMKTALQPLRICAAVAEPEAPELIAMKVRSASGYWDMIAEDQMIQFWANREGGYTAIRLTVEEWRRVIGEFPEVCRMMGVMQTEGAG